jgi:hypothetical protein
MYYIEKDNKIVLFDENKQKIQTTLEFMPQYKDLEIQETDKNIVIFEGQYYLEDDEEYIEKSTKQRKDLFLKDFFKVEGYGYYRKQPKGYQSAVESMNVLFNIANVSKGIQAGLIIFYEEPDFTKAEECTEEWLVQHQIIEPAMTLEQFMDLYIAFMTAWNNQEHKESVGE